MRGCEDLANAGFEPDLGPCDCGKVPIQDCDCCPACKGSGETQVYDTTRGPYGESYDVACEDCGGTGSRAKPSTLGA